MQVDEVLRAAETRALQLEVPRPPADAEAERLREDCARFFARLPEPPVYRRAEDPARRIAEALIPEASELYARCLALSRDGGVSDRTVPLGEAVRAHLTALCHTSAGRLTAAEANWLEGRERERRAAGLRRLWGRSDEVVPPAYDPKSGRSRYDPAPEPHVQVTLSCIRPGCRKVGSYAFSPRHSTHQFTCNTCQQPFVGFFGEAEGAQVTEEGRGKRYRFRIAEINGGHAKVEFEESSGAKLPVAPRDMLAFLYDVERNLHGVLNLSTSQMLWIQRGSCFVATAAFGTGAPELDAFRAFRDRVLLPTLPGRLFVRGYYAAGPALAAEVTRRPRLKTGVRWALGRVHAALLKGGYGR